MSLLEILEILNKYTASPLFALVIWRLWRANNTSNEGWRKDLIGLIDRYHTIVVEHTKVLQQVVDQLEEKEP